MSPEIFAAQSGAALGDLPDGSRVAFVTMLGSLCPVTRAHLQMFEEAKKLLLLNPRTDLGLGPYSACLGRISLNPDKYITQKLEQKREKMAPLRQHQRRELVKLATWDAGMPWVKYGDKVGEELEELEEQWPHLLFDRVVLNGADDVVRHEKWKWEQPERNIMITMGRPCSIEALRQGMPSRALSHSRLSCSGWLHPMQEWKSSISLHLKKHT